MKVLRDFTQKKVIILSQRTILDQMRKVKPLGEISNEEDIVTKHSKHFENLDDKDQSSHNNNNSSNYENTSESDDDTILALVRKRKQMKSKDKRDEKGSNKANMFWKNVTKKEMFKHQHQLQ